MSFYRILSEYYDQIFPVEPGELDFLIEQVRGRESLLDIGCGTGNKTEQFKDAVKVVIGIDIDNHMLEKARKDHPAANIVYAESDIMSLDMEFSEESLDAILCLGNTLAHLKTLSQLDRVLSLTVSRLAVGGRIVLQTLNYDRIFKYKIQELPVIETDKIKFCRHYRWHGEHIYFLTSLTVKGTGKVYSTNTQLCPVQSTAISNGLTRAGMESIRLYGSFSGAPWEAEESFMTVIIADKLKSTQDESHGYKFKTGLSGRGLI